MRGNKVSEVLCLEVQKKGVKEARGGSGAMFAECAEKKRKCMNVFIAGRPRIDLRIYFLL